jgi:preprotein translocase subunit SecE
MTRGDLRRRVTTVIAIIAVAVVILAIVATLVVGGRLF